MPWIDPEKQRLYNKKWNQAFYRNNATQEKARVAKRKQALRDWFDEYKRTLKCARCAERHPACLDFHHRDPKSKDFTLGNIKQRGWGKERILEEVGKCVVLCANCHRKLHAKQGGR